MQAAKTLELFNVRNLAGEIILRGFDDKERAKEARDELQAGTPMESEQYFVTYGRAHRKYRGE